MRLTNAMKVPSLISPRCQSLELCGVPSELKPWRIAETAKLLNIS